MMSEASLSAAAAAAISTSSTALLVAVTCAGNPPRLARYYLRVSAATDSAPPVTPVSCYLTPLVRERGRPASGRVGAAAGQPAGQPPGRGDEGERRQQRDPGRPGRGLHGRSVAPQRRAGRGHRRNQG